MGIRAMPMKRMRAFRERIISDWAAPPSRFAARVSFAA